MAPPNRNANPDALTQILQQMLADREVDRTERQANLAVLQQLAQNNQGHGNHDHPGSKLKNFQNTNPPVFSKTEEPLDADDWLQTMENNLEVAEVEEDDKMEGKLNQANENRKRRMMHQRAQRTPPSFARLKRGFTLRTTATGTDVAPPVIEPEGGNPRTGGHHHNSSNFVHHNNNFNRAPTRAPANPNTNTAPRTGSNAIPVASKDKSTINCYECGVVGHYSKECPQRLAKMPPTPLALLSSNACNMNKELPELFAMLKSAEIEIKKEHQVLMVNKTTGFKKQGKSKGKNKKSGKKAATPPVKPKSGPKPDAECYYGKEKGHWKRNCSKYLADLKSGHKKKEELPDSRKAVENKWIFKRKTDADGNITVYKARLVAKGFQGVDYDETFSPVAKLKSVRILLAIAAFFDYEIWQMDVKTAFLNGDIEEELIRVTHLKLDVEMGELEYGMEFEYLFGVPDEIPDITRSSGMVRRIRFIYRMSFYVNKMMRKVLWKFLEGSRKVRKKPPRKVESTRDPTSMAGQP
ncbi:hypothetical protein QYE76_020712 [Lolium multiflorum]|uniref:CCHC-type domain-containing protein n=1 Tax=Lolium multiflorum TaxID=4521 RepID=A0AAD8R5C0_LOLMU|nr:hypothetical protein QYE76_020712 [Lolium multiflorum]